jgi:hypothetical protein
VIVLHLAGLELATQHVGASLELHVAPAHWATIKVPVYVGAAQMVAISPPVIVLQVALDSQHAPSILVSHVTPAQ